jgi:hypothetical protein
MSSTCNTHSIPNDDPLTLDYAYLYTYGSPVQVDGGPIVVQKRCEVRPDDTAEALKVSVGYF